MAFEQKPNTGSLFKNEKKLTDTHPDYTGSVLVDGVAYWQDAWINKDKNGKTYMSQKFKPKEQKAARPQEQVKPAKSPSRASDDDMGGARVMPKRADMDDEIPFLMEWR